MLKGIDYIAVGCWGIITNDRQEILLLKRNGNDYWERPGGNVEVGELLTQAIEREVLEETGIVAKAAEFIEFEEIFWAEDKKHWLSFCYHLKHVSGEAVLTEPDRHSAVQWFPLDDLPKLSQYTKTSLNKFMSK